MILEARYHSISGGAKAAKKVGNLEPFIGSDIGFVAPPMCSHCFLNQRYRDARAALEDCVAWMGELLTRVTELRSLEA